MSDGETTSVYARAIDLVSDRLIQCVEVVKSFGYIDIVSLQVLTLVSFVAHVSSLHALSKNLRHFCIYLLQDLQINLLDAPSKHGSNDMTPESETNAPLRYSTRLGCHTCQEIVLINVLVDYFGN